MREILTGCITGIRQHLPLQEGEHFHPSIHEFRRGVKRIRAILRLFRDEIGYSNYFRENRYFRDLARRLSPVRDYYVLHQLIESMEKKRPELMDVEDFERLKKLSGLRTEQESKKLLERAGGFEQAATSLAQAEERMDHYCRIRESFCSMGTGIRRTYKQGRRYLGKEPGKFDAEVLHEYRKNTKYLLFQMEALQPLFPRLLKAYATTIEKHDQLLGDICDLDRLESFIRTGVPGLLPLCSAQKLQGKITLLRRNLMTRAFSSSYLIYAEKPGQFVKRLDAYWNHSFGITQNKTT